MAMVWLVVAAKPPQPTILIQALLPRLYGERRFNSNAARQEGAPRSFCQTVSLATYSIATPIRASAAVTTPLTRIADIR